MKKSFSIIIPAYNSEKYIEKCIDSILEQDYDMSKVEIIIIDDGSSDNTRKLIEKYSTNKAVRYYHKNNGQWGSAINYAKNNMLLTNEYISILDADDVLAIDAFKIVNKELDDQDIYAAAFNNWDGTKIKRKNALYFYFLKKNITNKIAMQTPYCHTSSIYVKKDIFYKVNDLLEGAPYQDTDLIAQFFYLCKNVRCSRSSITLYYNNRDGNSMSQPWNDARFNAEIYACKQAIKNDAQEIVSFRLNMKEFYLACLARGFTFEVHRKFLFKYFPFYLRPFYALIHFAKYKKLFNFI